MSELFNNYEQQFGNLSAEITAKICKIPNLHGGRLSKNLPDVSLLNEKLHYFCSYNMFFFTQRLKEMLLEMLNEGLTRRMSW